VIKRLDEEDALPGDAHHFIQGLPWRQAVVQAVLAADKIKGLVGKGQLFHVFHTIVFNEAKLFCFFQKSRVQIGGKSLCPVPHEKAGFKGVSAVTHGEPVSAGKMPQNGQTFFHLLGVKKIRHGMLVEQQPCAV